MKYSVRGFKVLWGPPRGMGLTLIPAWWVCPLVWVCNVLPPTISLWVIRRVWPTVFPHDRFDH